MMSATGANRKQSEPQVMRGAGRESSIEDNEIEWQWTCWDDEINAWKADVVAP